MKKYPLQYYMADLPQTSYTPLNSKQMLTATVFTDHTIFDVG